MLRTIDSERLSRNTDHKNQILGNRHFLQITIFSHRNGKSWSYLTSIPSKQRIRLDVPDMASLEDDRSIHRVLKLVHFENEHPSEAPSYGGLLMILSSLCIILSPAPLGPSPVVPLWQPKREVLVPASASSK